MMSVSQKRLHSNAHLHTATVTTGTLEEKHWEVSHTPTIVLTWQQMIFICFVHLKRPYKEKYLEQTMKMNFLCNDGFFLKAA
jgi:hypothetical protein